MERYSDRAIEIINELHRERLDYQSEYLPLIDAANKLSAYEDTGLEPEQVVQTIAPESLRPKAHWIHKRTKFPGGELPVVECSLCECQQWKETNFCPACGAKMEDREE